jgi:hypothetical protein
MSEWREVADSVEKVENCEELIFCRTTKRSELLMVLDMVTSQ